MAPGSVPTLPCPSWGRRTFRIHTGQAVGAEKLPLLDRGHITLRQHLRVSGPFEGRRLSAFPVPISIHDLSVGGCLIESFNEQPAGRRMTLEIDLPFVGSLTVEAESLYTREGYGFAVKFVDVSDDARATLEEVVMRLLG
jgi:hypothetical protein